jgi:hypothetical protein
MTQALQLAQYGSNNVGLSFKNRIINGDMSISQRLGTSSVTPTTLYSQYTLDRWTYNGSQASRASVQQNAGSVTPPAGFTNYLGITSLSAYSVTSSDFFGILQHIEGFNTADLAFGTVSASPVTLSFWVRSSLTGTFGGNLANSANNRNYVFSYTINSANTWEQKSITVPGDTTGTWLTNNGIGLQVVFSIGSGSNFTTTAGSWSASSTYAPTGQTSVVGTNGATFYITGVQLEKGTVATSFDYLPYTTELQLCQRYCVRFLGNSAYSASPSALNAYSSAGAQGPLTMPVTMRAVPTYTASTLLFTDVSSINNSISSSSVDSGQSGTQSVWIDIQSSGLTISRTGYVKANNSTSAFIILSAEL